MGEWFSMTLKESSIAQNIIVKNENSILGLLRMKVK